MFPKPPLMNKFRGSRAIQDQSWGQMFQRLDSSDSLHSREPGAGGLRRLRGEEIDHSKQCITKGWLIHKCHGFFFEDEWKWFYFGSELCQFAYKLFIPALQRSRTEWDYVRDASGNPGIDEQEQQPSEQGERWGCRCVLLQLCNLGEWGLSSGCQLSSSLCRY